MNHQTRARALLERDNSIAAIDAALLGLAEASAEERRELRLLVGRAYEKMRQHPQALGYLNRVLDDAPDHAHALAHRGSVLDRMFQKDRAKADLERAIELDPDYAHAWENLFYVSFDTQDYDTCDRALENLQRLGADKGYLYRLRGAHRLEDGDREGGETDLRKACVHAIGDTYAADVMTQADIELKVGDEFAMFAVQRERDDVEASITNFNKALELGLSSPRRDLRTVERMGKMLCAAGRTEEAIEAARALTARHPDRADVWLTRAALDGDIASYESAYKLSTKEGAVPYARQLMAVGHTQDALEVCRKHVEQDADDDEAQALLGDLHMALGNRDEAKAAWLRAEALGSFDARSARCAAFGPEYGMDHFDEGINLLERNLRDDAVAEWETAAELFRKETRVPGDRAHRHIARSLYNSAFTRELQVGDSILEPNLREAVELDPYYADAMLALGNLCLRTDRVSEGLNWFAKAGETNPAAGQPWFYRARHFKDLSDFENTIEDATKAFDAYARAGQGQFAADAVMIRGEANEALGNLHAAKADYDMACDYGHPTGYAMGDHIRERIAIEDPSSDEALEIVDRVVEQLEDGECPWGEIDFVDAKVANSEKAMALVDKLKEEEALDEEQVSWLCEFLQS